MIECVGRRGKVGDAIWWEEGSEFLKLTTIIGVKGEYTVSKPFLKKSFQVNENSNSVQFFKGVEPLKFSEVINKD